MAARTPTLTLTPYVVIFDTREQAPFSFVNPLRGRNARELLSIRTERGTLTTGDYSLVGFENRIAVERKSLADWYGTLGRGRIRFTRELERLNALDFAAVVVEAEWSEILTAPPVRSRLHPRSVLGSVIAWQVRYPRVCWCFLPGRDAAEGYVARMLDRWWKENAG